MRIVFDRYMLHARALSTRPQAIHSEWADGVALFRIVDPFGGCGCLTQVRLWGTDYAASRAPRIRELCMEVSRDVRIPAYPEDITVEHLPVFVEWQRRLDAELGEDRNG
jgi:hypothetical protein